MNNFGEIPTIQLSPKTILPALIPLVEYEMNYFKQIKKPTVL